MPLVLFNPCYHSGPEWTWERWYSAFPKAPALLSVINRTLVGGWSYPSAEVQSVYSTTPADWASRSK